MLFRYLISWQRRPGAGALFTAQPEREFAVHDRVGQQRVAGLLGEGLEVAHRTGVGCDDAQHFAAGEFGSTEERERTRAYLRSKL